MEEARQPPATPFAAALIGERVARDPVEPWSSPTPGGHLLQPAPGREEGLGHDVFRVLAAGGPPKHVSENAGVVRVVDGAKLSQPVTVGRRRPGGGLRGRRLTHDAWRGVGTPGFPGLAVSHAPSCPAIAGAFQPRTKISACLPSGCREVLVVLERGPIAAPAPADRLEGAHDGVVRSDDSARAT